MATVVFVSSLLVTVGYFFTTGASKLLLKARSSTSIFDSTLILCASTNNTILTYYKIGVSKIVSLRVLLVFNVYIIEKQ